MLLVWVSFWPCLPVPCVIPPSEDRVERRLTDVSAERALVFVLAARCQCTPAYLEYGEDRWRLRLVQGPAAYTADASIHHVCTARCSFGTAEALCAQSRRRQRQDSPVKRLCQRWVDRTSSICNSVHFTSRGLSRPRLPDPSLHSMTPECHAIRVLLLWHWHSNRTSVRSRKTALSGRATAAIFDPSTPFVTTLVASDPSIDS